MTVVLAGVRLANHAGVIALTDEPIAVAAQMH